MDKRWIFGTLLVLLVGFIAAGIVFGDGNDWHRNRGVEVVHVTDDSGTTSPTGTGSTIIIERGRGFFPFGLFLFPLFFFLVCGFLGRAFWGARRWGPSDGAPSAQWLEEWHRKQHQDTPTGPDDTNSTSQ